MLRRRIANHMLAAGVADDGEYVSRLDDSAMFVRDAIERFTIKVSRFYRNPAVFDAIFRQLLSLQQDGCARPFHIWSAGTGCGEEPYTLAMLLVESGLDGRVIASDIDDVAIQRCADGIYDRASVDTIPEAWRARHFEPVSADRVRVSDHLRDRVRFVRHDLTGTTEPPAGPFDLVSCRNVLIYFERDAQQCALEHLLHSLAPGGTLVLGEAEWPVAPVSARLSTVSSSLRIFRYSAPQGIA